MGFYRLGMLLLICTGASGCAYISQGIGARDDRYAQIAGVDSLGDTLERVVYPEQNWSSADSLWFYNIPQGSTLIPYTLFLHLEMPDSKDLYRGDVNMNQLRYLPQRASAANPDALPVGWTKDTHAGKTYIGLTCAACHTSQINYQGVGIRIDGGAALADMEKMLKSLSDSLTASLESPEKFERLAKKVLQKKYPADRDRFRAELADTAQQIASYNKINEPRHGDQPVAYGYARLDAFGRIYNRILAHLTPNEDNSNPANAPVSYSYLWDTPQHDFVQWNGVGDNELNGPLARNVGQAMGVFAQFNLDKQAGDKGYRSSVNKRNLIRIERHLESLWSPSWEELAGRRILPAIDSTLAAKGRQVYIDYHCHSCHEAIDRTDAKRRINAQFSSLQTIGTDPFTAMNALNYTGKTGYFAGEHTDPRDPNSPRFKETAPVLPALSLAVAGVIAEPDRDKNILQRWSEDTYDMFASISENPVQHTDRRLDFEKVNKHQPATLAAYKARPLNGVWATAPYLHNGSVPSLYELFMPSCTDAEIASGKICRPNRFVVGGLEFDPIKVGSVQRDPAEYPKLFVFDTRLPGNSNKGHEYAAGVTPVFVLDAHGRPVKDAEGIPQMRKLTPITPEQRLALVEYLKTL